MQLMLAQKCAECRPDAFQMQVPTSSFSATPKAPCRGFFLVTKKIWPGTDLSPCRPATAGKNLCLSAGLFLRCSRLFGGWCGLRLGSIIRRTFLGRWLHCEALQQLCHMAILGLKSAP